MCDNEINHKSEQIIQSSFDFMKEELIELIKKAKTIELQEKKKKEYEEELRKKQKEAEEAKRKENELKRQMMEVEKKIDDLNQQTGVFNANQKNISCNYQIYSFDEIHFIYGNGFDAEARLINERKSHDIYPQIPNYCINLLMDGKSKQSIIICFNKKTRPHWTWFYFKPGFTKQNTIGTCDMNRNVVNLNGKTYQCDEKQILNGFDNIFREIRLIKERESYDNYPQGAYYCIDILSQGIENKKYVTMFIKKTRPHWTWFYFL